MMRFTDAEALLFFAPLLVACLALAVSIAALILAATVRRGDTHFHEHYTEQVSAEFIPVDVDGDRWELTDEADWWKSGERRYQDGEED